MDNNYLFQIHVGSPANDTARLFCRTLGSKINLKYKQNRETYEFNKAAFPPNYRYLTHRRLNEFNIFGYNVSSGK